MTEPPTLFSQVVLCPQCGGQKTQSRPPWIAGDLYEWVSGGTADLYACVTCDGKGYLVPHG